MCWPYVNGVCRYLRCVGYVHAATCVGFTPVCTHATCAGLWPGQA